MNRNGARTGLLLTIVLLMLALPAFAQQVDLDQIGARDELRWGVSSYHAGNLNESIVSLNRSLAFNSSQTVARYWLGRAYYAAGFEEAALVEWERVLSQGGRTAVLENWIERVELQRGLTPERLGSELTPGRLVTMAEVAGLQGDQVIFRRPAMVRPRSDGYFYVASFATHQVLLMDPNGVLQEAFDGGIQGFDRPFDVLILEDGDILVSEFGADRITRISSQGFPQGTFGGTGRSEGRFLGPQYLTGDDRGFVYVSDYGNRRVSKFTADGEHVLSFGRPVGEFEGLREPTGLVWHAGRIYVSDAQLGEVVVFDESGNYVGTLAAGEIEQPEAVSVYRDGILLVADANQLFALRIETGEITLLADLAPRHELVGAVVDANRNVIVSDFRSDLLLFMAPSEELYTGLRVEVDHVIASEHPEIFVAVDVRDRNGNPLLGMDGSNFRITEDRFPTGQATVARAGYRTGEIAVSVIVDRSAAMGEHAGALEEAAGELAAAISPRGSRWLVSAGEQPLVVAGPDDGPLAFASAAAGERSDYGLSSFDLAVRLAGSQIIREIGRRAIIFVTDGSELAEGFENYGLVETASFLSNNHISFHVVYTRRNQSVEELEYLVRETGGQSVFQYQPQGLGVLVNTIARQPSGTYLLSYTSVHDSDFGRRYIPLEVEAYLLRRSGRDESGYYGPLEF